MENTNILIKKYKISEIDLYALGVIESRKQTAGFFKKEGLKSKSMRILKPYNVKFLDLGILLKEIKDNAYEKNQIFIEKYGSVEENIDDFFTRNIDKSKNEADDRVK
jgi:hypothetical protein